MALAIHTKTGILFGIGAVLVASSAIFIVFWPSLFLEQMKEQLILTNTSRSFDLWKETPVPMYLELFLYNFTNSAEVLANPDNVVPFFTEMGPYVFRESHFKTNITWNDNGTVTYFNKRVWYFEPDKSNGSLTDEVTNINVVIAAATFSSRYLGSFMQFMLNLALTGRSFVITKSAGEWLFDGFEDELLILGNIFPGHQMPDRFGWFYDRNNSEIFDGQFDMLTGATDLGALGLLSGWHGSNRTGLWEGACGEVRGSGGELFAPQGPTNPMNEIEIFASDLCTYLTLRQNGHKEVDGITGDLFVADDTVFDNGHRFPSQACYCHEPRDETCVPSGALNVSACKLGAPAFVSFPHFFQADEFYNSRVDGLKPSIDDQFQVAIEPVTGMPLFVRAQLQINIMLRRISAFTITNTMPENVFIPMLWFRQEISMSDEFAAEAHSVLFLRWGIVYIGYAVVGLGVIFVIAGVILLLKHLWRSEETIPLLSNQS